MTVRYIKQPFSDDYKIVGEGNPAGYDEDEEIMKTGVLVFNTSTLKWERMKQPVIELTGDLTVSLGDVERLLANQYYKRMKPFSYASGRVKYICRNTDIGAGETDTDWFCWKFTDASPPESEGPLEGAVNSEAAVNGLGWNI